MKKLKGSSYELEERKIFLSSRIGYVQYNFQEKLGQKIFRVNNVRYGKLTRIGISYIIEPDGKGRIVLHNHRIDKR